MPGCSVMPGRVDDRALMELDVVVEALLVADLQIVLAVEVGDPAVDVLFSVWRSAVAPAHMTARSVPEQRAVLRR